MICLFGYGLLINIFSNEFNHIENIMKNRMIACIIASVIVVLCTLCFGDLWSDLINPNMPLTLSNTFEASVSVVGITIQTNQAVDMGLVVTREEINRNVWQIYSNIIMGKLSYTTNGNVPVANF